MKVRRLSRPVFTVRFTEGLATKHRLPLDHVIRVLNEFRGLFESVGKQIERQRGAEEPTGDFGIEVVGGFQKGSFVATLALTKNTEVGALVASQILDTVNRLGSPTKAKRDAVALARTDFDPKVVSRLSNISKVQEIDKTKMDLALRKNGGKTMRAVVDRRAVRAIAAMRDPNFSIDGLTVYGKLRSLRDKYDNDEDSKKAFYGELVADDGNLWRIEFKAADVERAASLFRRQVFVTGDATYFRALHPKIVAREFGPEQERDYEAAFDELFGSSPELKGIALADLVAELRGDDR